MPRRGRGGYVPPLEEVIKAYLSRVSAAAELNRHKAQIAKIFGVTPDKLEGPRAGHWEETFKGVGAICRAIRYALDYTLAFLTSDVKKAKELVKEAFRKLIEKGIISSEDYNRACEMEGLPDLKI